MNVRAADIRRVENGGATQEALPRHKVLMFAYYFPPLGGSGVQRTLKYVKYLPEHGFDPLVVTGRPRWASQLADESLLSEVPPSATVVRLRRSPSTTRRARSTASWAASGSPAGW